MSSAMRETRRIVTVLFADVTGSTALGEQIDPESLRRVMARYFETARECLERHGGTVEKFVGDAVMAIFGVPIAHEDDALRAVRAADDLRTALIPLNDELQLHYGVALQLRTGVNTGVVVTGTGERLATGDTVNVAARLEQAAQPGEILLGYTTLQLTRGAIEAEPVEDLQLKGKSERTTAHRLVSVVKNAPAYARRFDVPLVGRRRELALIHRAFDEAVTSRRSRLVTVLGPPGIGKSRLAREAEGALADQAVVLSGRCLPYGVGITYLPLVDIFRQAGAEAELGQALSAKAPEEIFWEVRKLLEAHARRRPLALIFEDIHWAEPTLLDLIEHLATWVRDAPVLLLCLARTELRDQRPGWTGAIVALDPLSQSESDQLIDELADGVPFNRSMRAKIRAVAEGNPLFVEQLLARVAEGDDLTDVPPTINALLAARLDALPESERELLERASVVGLEFDWATLTQLFPDRRRPPGARLTALVRKELIRPHEATSDVFQFRHMLVRDAAYDRIPKEVRSELHERAGRWFDGLGPELEEVVGYHAEQAQRYLAQLGPIGERGRLLGEWAAQRLATAGRRAYGRGDVRAAANLLDRAISLLSVDDPQRLALLASFGRALRDAGQLERAESVLLDAVDRGRAAGEPVVAADADVALADLQLHRRSIARDEALRRVAAATSVFKEAGDETRLARALTLSANLLFWVGQAASAIRLLERAAEHAFSAGDREQQAEILQRECVLQVFGPTPVAEALARLAELGERAEQSVRVQVSRLENEARLEAMCGRFQESGELLARATSSATAHGRAIRESERLATCAAEIALLAGDPVAAELAIRPICENLEAVGEFGNLASSAAVLLEALYQQGRYAEASLLAERWRADRLTVPEDVDAHVGWRRVRAKLLARRGETEEAIDLARQAVSMADRTDLLGTRAQAHADLAEVLRLRGHKDASERASEEAIRLYEQKGNVAAAAKLRGALVETTGEG